MKQLHPLSGCYSVLPWKDTVQTVSGKCFMRGKSQSRAITSRSFSHSTIQVMMIIGMTGNRRSSQDFCEIPFTKAECMCIPLQSRHSSAGAGDISSGQTGRYWKMCMKRLLQKKFGRQCRTSLTGTPKSNRVLPAMRISSGGFWNVLTADRRS